MSDSAARSDALARLAATRAEIRRVLEPAPHARAEGAGGDTVEGSAGGTFPRSRTMQLLTSGRGVGTVAAMLGGLVMARPALALRLLRMIPVGTVARLAVVKALSAWRARGP